MNPCLSLLSSPISLSVWLKTEASFPFSILSAISLSTIPIEKQKTFFHDEMKQCVCDQVNIMAPDEAAELPAKKRKAFFACQKPSLIEEEISTFSMLAMQDEDPLIFWSNNEKYFPRLALLSRLMLAVAASSASSERAFKELRCVLGNFARNRLDPKKTAALIHLRTNWVKNCSKIYFVNCLVSLSNKNLHYLIYCM
uniref:HAT C-terminal dimerisation domain-containing protein n=1 Tax=Ditylenchus dipsaci TaxID=166011 RepID=A0A915DFY5_9BILA